MYVYIRSSTIARLAEIGYGTVAKKGISFEEFRQLDKKRKCDVELLNAWKVGTIIDLMVEKEKQKYLFAYVKCNIKYCFNNIN